MNNLIWIVVSAFFTSCFVTFFLWRAPAGLQILDHPNNRSLHLSPITRTGGLGIWAGCGVGVLLLSIFMGDIHRFVWVGYSVSLVGLISFADDLEGVPVLWRITVHLVAAGVIGMSEIGPNSIKLPGISIVLPSMIIQAISVLLCIWMINLYNFMDGMDGFAGGMAVIGFGTLGLLGFYSGDIPFALLCWTVAAASGGFVVWNFPPARIFMGDLGSSTLGLIAVSLSYWADRNSLFPLWVSFLIFSPFIIDATVTLCGRIWKGERIWEAHKTHYYQRLAQAGLGHRKTVLWEYGLMGLCSGGALIALDSPVELQWFILGFFVLIYFLAIFSVKFIENRHSLHPSVND